MEKYYSAEIEEPKTNKEGLLNFLQMIINDIEADEYQEALYKAVDLRDSVLSGLYTETVVVDEVVEGVSKSEVESLVAEAYEGGRKTGRKEKAAELARVLAG